MVKEINNKFDQRVVYYIESTSGIYDNLVFPTSDHAYWFLVKGCKINKNLIEEVSA